TYTLLGNHDQRLNPYPPRITGEAVHIFLLLYFVLVCAGSGAVSGLCLGLFEELRAEDGDVSAEDVIITLVQLLICPFASSLSLVTFFLIIGSLGLDFDTSFDIFYDKFLLIVGLGWILGFVINGILLLIQLKDPKPITNAGSGTLWGLALGSGFGGVVTIIGAVFLFQTWDYMDHVVNLLASDFEALLQNNNVAYLNAFGTDGLLHMDERAFDWYALVINPFRSYAFDYGNSAIMMADWEGSEILTADPPVADDSFTDRQWKQIEAWIAGLVIRRNNLTQADQDIVPILGLHTPVFCPMTEDNLDDLNRVGTKPTASNLERGTMEERRKDLIELFFKLSEGTYPGLSKPIPAISLTGHTHTYDVFRMDQIADEQRVFWFERKHFMDSSTRQVKADFQRKGLHITTSCAGPPSDDRAPGGSSKQAKLDARQGVKPQLKGFDQQKTSVYTGTPIQDFYQLGSRVARPAGARILAFNRQTGHIVQIDEISAQTAKWGDI
ncbi:MAG: hypothetical protein WCD18_05325, partial [Thermosynechococcaceae cyanobacterium]